MTEKITMRLSFHYPPIGPSRIRRMSARRRKAAFGRWLRAKVEARLLEYVGAENIGSTQEAIRLAIEDVVLELVPPASMKCEVVD